MTSTAASLVLGCATRIPPRLVGPFARSLRATDYKGRLGLVLGLYGEAETRTLAGLADYAVSVDVQYPAVGEPLVSTLRWMRTTRRVRRAYPLAFSAAAMNTRAADRLSRWRALEFRLEGLQALRYRHYHDIITTVGADADQVLLTDVRDVVFQRDPFAETLDGLEVFLEDSSLTIGGEARNRKWVRTLYGDRGLAACGHEVVSCSGTIAGPREHTALP